MNFDKICIAAVIIEIYLPVQVPNNKVCFGGRGENGGDTVEFDRESFELNKLLIKKIWLTDWENGFILILGIHLRTQTHAYNISFCYNESVSLLTFLGLYQTTVQTDSQLP